MKKLLFLSLVIVCLLTACGTTKPAGDIAAPSADKISSVKIVTEDAVTTTNDKKVIANLLKELATAQDSGRESVNDKPNEDIIAEITLEADGGENITYYLYFDKDNLYLEQPYHGIYSIDKSFLDTLDSISLPFENTNQE